jgi:hypothetical protein
MVKVKNAVKQGYTRMSGHSSLSSSLMCTKNKRTATVSTMPIKPQTIQAGKYDPRILNEGAREHPAAHRAEANDAMAAEVRSRSRLGSRLGRRPRNDGPSGDGEFPVNFSFPLAVISSRIGLRPFRMKQVARLKSQGSHPGQELRPRGDIGCARGGKGALG